MQWLGSFSVAKVEEPPSFRGISPKSGTPIIPCRTTPPTLPPVVARVCTYLHVFRKSAVSCRAHIVSIIWIAQIIQARDTYAPNSQDHDMEISPIRCV